MLSNKVEGDIIILFMFSPAGTFPAVGLFSLAHIIAILLCLFFVGLAVHFTRNMQEKTYLKLLKIFTIVLTVMELFKISWSLGHGLYNVNSWVPLYFCSLFLYSLWFTWSKNNFVKRLGLSYIAMAGVVAGLVFIVFPTTSFRTYPIFHFQCLYSMIYHSIMVYSGIMVFVANALKIDKKAVISYCAYCAIFMSLAILININFADGNMMFLAHPGGIPLPFLFTIYNFSNVLYTVVMILAHMSLGLIVLGIHKIMENRAKKLAKLASQNKVVEQSEEISEKVVGEEFIDLEEDLEEKHS